MPTYREDMHTGHKVPLVETDDIMKGAVTTDKLDNNAVTTDKLADDAVTNDKIADQAVDNRTLAPDSITNEKVVDNTLTGDKFQDDSIGGEKIKDNTVPGSKLADGSITGIDIQDGTLPGTKLVDGTVSGAKLSDNAIESRHLLDNSIPGEKIKDNTIENVDIKDGTLGGEKIKDNTIEGTKIADGAIGTDKIVDNSVNTGKIADGAVTKSKIADNSVTNAKIGAGAVTTGKIENEAITEEKLAPGAVTTEKLSDGMIEQLQTITDAVPTVGSVKPMQSGGVLVHGGAFDISEYNKNGDTLATYETLADALAAVPASVVRSGMSIKFILRTNTGTEEEPIYHDEYVQYRLMADDWSTDASDWALCGEDVLVENPEWIRVYTDNNGRLLFGIKADASIEWAVGIPTPVKAYIDGFVNGTDTANIDGLNKIIDFLDEFSTSDTLKSLLDTKVDKEANKSLIPTQYIEEIDNPEFVDVKTDADNKILWAIKPDGTIYWGAGVPQQVIDYVTAKIEELSLDEYEDIVTFLNGIQTGGNTLQELLNEKVDKVDDKELISSQYIQEENNNEYISSVVDANKVFLAGFKKNDGKLNLPTQGIADIENTPKNLECTEGKDGEVIDETFYDGKVCHHTEHTFDKNVNFQRGFTLPDGTFVDSLYNNDIERIYNKHDYEPILNNLKRTPATFNSQLFQNYQRVSFLHFSDVHKSEENTERIMQFYYLYRKYIDDVILTGDIAEGNYNDYNDNFESIKGYKDNVLRVIGNHDVFDPTNTSSGLICTPSQVYTKFFKGIENWGVVQPNVNPEQKCYYYKDYPNGNIRLIVIDIMRFISPWNWGYEVGDAEQRQWLIDTLDDSIGHGEVGDSDYKPNMSVIIAAHWVPATEATSELLNTPFSDKGINITSDSHSSEDLLSIVDTFIDNGGEFICWLGGHRHADLCGTTHATGSTNKQLFIEVGCAIGRDYWNNYCRMNSNKTFDLFNMISFDTHLKLITAYRFGADYNNILQHKASLAIDYVNKEIII